MKNAKFVMHDNLIRIYCLEQYDKLLKYNPILFIANLSKKICFINKCVTSYIMKILNEISTLE